MERAFQVMVKARGTGTIGGTIAEAREPTRPASTPSHGVSAHGGRRF